MSQTLERLRQLERSVERLESLAAAIEVRPPRPTEVVALCLFTLIETLAQADAARAVQLDWDVDADGLRKTTDQIIVGDPLASFHGQTYTRGFAFKGLGWERWNIVQMACTVSAEDNT